VPDADKFYNDVTHLDGREWEGINYAVFGSGANVFETTYQLVPRRIDECIAARGGNPICPLGQGDVGVFLYDTWEEWRRTMWEKARGVRLVFFFLHYDAQPIAR
jgi:sulfite reductase alpha subunit-like flavoprotein